MTAGLVTSALVGAGGRAGAATVGDPAFGTKGVVSFDFDGADDSANAVARQPDGKLVVVGTATIADDADVVVVRLLPDGSPDPGFGAGGFVIVDSGGPDHGVSVALDGDGGILVGGDAGSNSALVVRLQSDGEPDPGFGAGGVAQSWAPNFFFAAAAMARQPDGQILVAGAVPGGGNNQTDFAVSRFSATGTADAGFGWRTTDFGSSSVLSHFDSVTSLAVQPDGRIVLAGSTSTPVWDCPPPNPPAGCTLPETGDAALARFLPDGALDPSFGSGGHVTTNLTRNGENRGETVNALALLADGRIVVAGASHIRAGLNEMLLARYRPDGTLDPSFGAAGVTLQPSPYGNRSATTLAVLGDGGLEVAGWGSASTGGRLSATRFRPDGALDWSFAASGNQPFDLVDGYEDAHAMLVLPDGALVVAGRADVDGDFYDNDFDMVVGRFQVSAEPSTPGPGLGTSAGDNGFHVVAADGGIFSYGGARFFGSMGATRLNRPVVGMAATPGGAGYWLVASDGGIFAFGDAGFFGSTGAMTLNKPIVGMAATPTGRGYWLVASDGGIFAYGDATFFGSTGAMTLNSPIVGMAATPAGGGYWFVAADGGIFAFGDARFMGSMGGTRLAQPIVGMAAAPDGSGYWLVARDGGVFTFGQARFVGAASGRSAAGVPIVAIAPTVTGQGYRIAAADGAVWAFGDAGTGVPGSTLAQPVVGMTVN